jgi:hypothetical protein
MPFTQNNNMSGYNGGNNFNNHGNNQNDGAPEKTSFRVGRMYGKHPTEPGKAAVLDIGLYVSKYSVYATLAIKYEMGRLSNGQVQFEAGLAKDNPSALLNAEQVVGIIDLFNRITPSDISKLNLLIDSGKSKFQIDGTETQTKFTVTNDKGSKSIKFDAMPSGIMNVHSSLELLKEYLKIVSKKQISYRLSPDEFNDLPAESGDSTSPF